MRCHLIAALTSSLLAMALACGCGRKASDDTAAAEGTPATDTGGVADDQPEARATKDDDSADADHAGDSRAAAPAEPHAPQVEISARLEAQTALLRGALFLVQNQADDGSWGEHPGITAMVVAALKATPMAEDEKGQAAVARALAYIRSTVTDEGTIRQDKATAGVYSSAACLLALKLVDAAEDRDRIDALRRHLVAGQTEQVGEFHYGATLGPGGYPDLSNTHWALEAIRLTRRPAQGAPTRKLWARATALVTQCQVDAPDNPAAHGGFLYYPPGEQPEEPAHEKTQVVWGSLTFGGLKTLFFAGVKPDDPRIQRGLAWVNHNYTLERNPGLDQGGLYYYYYMLSSALRFLDRDTVTTADGVQHNWRQELAEVLLSRQRGDGQWTNDNRLWLESKPELCTAYAIKALEFALRE